MGPSVISLPCLGFQSDCMRWKMCQGWCFLSLCHRFDSRHRRFSLPCSHVITLCLSCASLELICLGGFVSLCAQFLSILSQFASVRGQLVSPCSHFFILVVSLHSAASLWAQFDIEILTVTSNSGRTAQGVSSPVSNAEMMLSKQQMLAIDAPIWLPLQPSTSCVLRPQRLAWHCLHNWSQAGERQLRPAGRQLEQLIPAEPAWSWPRWGSSTVIGVPEVI